MVILYSIEEISLYGTAERSTILVPMSLYKPMETWWFVMGKLLNGILKLIIKALGTLICRMAGK